MKKKYIWAFLKYAIPLAIVAWLVADVPRDQFIQLRDRPKNWPLLIAAFAITFTAISLTFVRWYLLVRALGLRFRLVDAFRLGFIGFLFNQVSAGAVGGDLFKAIFIAREQPGRRTEAVATVVVDRIVGLYALLLLTCGVILSGGMVGARPEVQSLCRFTLGVGALGGMVIMLLLVPGFTNGKVSSWLARLPRIGHLIERLINAMRVYRSRWSVVLLALLMSIGTHSMFAVAFYLIAHSLFVHVPTLREHLFLVPLAMVAGAFPFTPGGFGAFEYALKKLYEFIPAATNIDVAGILVALIYRLMNLGIAAIGLVVYWSARKEVRGLMDDAQRDLEAESDPDDAETPDQTAVAVGLDES